MDKTVATAQEAVADIVAGSTIAVGGFGLCGIPSVLLEALLLVELAPGVTLEEVRAKTGRDFGVRP
jgi:acyl CoA:acetate/3-ketoacid CoA transferase alpha subunit